MLKFIIAACECPSRPIQGCLDIVHCFHILCYFLKARLSKSRLLHIAFVRRPVPAVDLTKITFIYFCG